MKRFLALGALMIASGAAIAQYAPGAQILTSLVGSFKIAIINSGPQSAVVPLNGGTFTCAAGTATIANTHVDAGSLIVMTLKTVGGTAGTGGGNTGGDTGGVPNDPGGRGFIAA